MRPFRFLAALTLIAGLSATAALAEDDGGRDPSVDQYVVCSAIIESCLAACSTLSDKGGVLTPWDLCELQCQDAYRQCMKGLLRSSVALRQSARNPLLNFIGDGTPSDPSQTPGGTSGQPGGDGKPTDGGGFNPGAVFNGPATTIIR